MARPRVQLISGGVRRLLSDPGVRGDIQDKADKVLARARALAPVESGSLRASLQTRVMDEDRTVVAIGSPLGYALRINAATGFLTRALDGANDGTAPASDMVDYTRRDGTTIRVTRRQAANYGRGRR